MPLKIRSIKATLDSKFSASTEVKKRLKSSCSTAVSGLETILRIVKESVGNAGPPGLQGGISGVLFIIDVIKVYPYNCFSLH